jgi:hypothetical protein
MMPLELVQVATLSNDLCLPWGVDVKAPVFVIL